MTQPDISISCPKCGHEFKIDEAYEKEVIKKLEKEYQEKASKDAEKIENLKADLEKDKASLLKEKEQLDEVIKKKMEEQIKTLTSDTEKRVKEEYNHKLKSLEEENEKRKNENTELKKKEIEILRKEKDLEEAQEQMQLDMDKKMLEKQNEIEEKARNKEQEKSELKFKEYQKQLNDQKKLIEEMKRKSEQGSMQTQGEVLELALEDLLTTLFPVDKIDEVPKGIKGADVIHTVINTLQQECGKIIYESKRTKAFSEGWIDKLKDDQRTQQADIAVIVTETMPKDMDRFNQKHGVWICNFQEIKSLAYVLREMIIKTYMAKASQTNKGDKMEMLYDFLTGTEFRQQVESIVEGFTSMKDDLEKEKRSMASIWKTREKQIEKVINNTIDMYGSIKGIAGNAVASIKQLELSNIGQVEYSEDT
jgi:hypothetical protein